MTLCKNCKHSRTWGCHVVDYHCAHPSNVKVNPVNGKLEYTQYPDRLNHGNCDNYEKRVGFFRRLFFSQG